ncbi:MAG: ribonuclease III [candidate division Zixibacteria bacterium]|nr:ribonuclease III [candidate division Zixibacteria bacterium]
MGLFYFLKRLAGKSPNQTEKSLVDAFNQRLGYLFQNPAYLIQALTHRSFIKNPDNPMPSNERLEYLGDSILGMIIAEHLYRTFHEYDEGDLTKTKAFLVNESALAQAGKESGLNNFILLSAEEEKSGGQQRSSIIADAVEAVIGAIYLDGGLNVARNFVHRTIISRQEDILANINQHNYKGDLLEYLQARGEGAPIYEVVSEEGPDHEKVFKIAVHTNGKTTGTGTGSTKKEAEQQAAAAALGHLQPTKKNNQGEL